MQYTISGDTLPIVICNLEAGESMVTEGGGMSWMSPNMQMETTSNGGAGKAIGRMFSGEHLFQNIYTAQGGPGFIAFASSFPGSIMAFQLNGNNDLILQKHSFLASERSITLSASVNKKISSGLFGGEGFIMQRVSGNGIVFCEFDGHVVTYDLEAGQQIVVDTGHLAAMSSGCSLEAVTVKGVKNVLLGGEGLFNTVITGPGRVWLQTMPASNMAAALSPYISTGS